jgi:hypothetical protein
MDFSKLMSTMLSGDSVSNMSQVTGTSQKDVTNVLSAMLPSLLDGAKGQATNAETAAGFANALSAHAKDDTTDLSAFLKNVDMEDGGKIISHLLGSQQQTATQKAAATAGLDVGQVGSILAAAAPLLMSLMGQAAQGQAAQGQQAGVQAAPDLSMLGSLFGKSGGGDITSLLSGLLGKK